MEEIGLNSLVEDHLDTGAEAGGPGVPVDVYFERSLNAISSIPCFWQGPIGVRVKKPKILTTQSIPNPTTFATLMLSPGKTWGGCSR
jgi:hypothetical protein